MMLWEDNTSKKKTLADAKSANYPAFQSEEAV